MYFIYFSDVFLLIFSYGKILRSFVYVIICCVGAGITTLMSISDGLNPYFFRRKMEKTRSMKEEIDGKVFISLQNRHFSLYSYYDYSIFPYLYLDLACKQLCFPPRKGVSRRNESTINFM